MIHKPLTQNFMNESSLGYSFKQIHCMGHIFSLILRLPVIVWIIIEAEKQALLR